jgi:hypothetical protein
LETIIDKLVEDGYDDVGLAHYVRDESLTGRDNIFCSR